MQRTLRRRSRRSPNWTLRGSPKGRVGVIPQPVVSQISNRADSCGLSLVEVQRCDQAMLREATTRLSRPSLAPPPLASVASRMGAQPSSKSFLYLSEKIEALFAQLPPQSWPDRDASLPDKASAVCEYLAKGPGLVGTVDAPLAYFWGELVMHVSSLSPFSNELIAYGGKTEKTCLALVGPASSRVAEIPADGDLGLGVQLYLYLARCGARLSADSWNLIATSGHVSSRRHGGLLSLYFRNFCAHWDCETPTQKVEFVARTIERCDVEGHTHLVASPLYIATSTIER
jgi:uncharacterized protein DUF7019